MNDLALLDHEVLPAVATAPLPASYEAAKLALAECVRVDECQQWADRAAALASYAKQADDQALLQMSRRIQARAIDRCGELLEEIEPAPGKRTDLHPNGGAPTRFETAKKAGLSRDQTITALRVHNVPRDQFEQLVEGDDPPTVTKLAEMGTVKRPVPEPPDYLNGRDPSDFERATPLIGLGDYIVGRVAEIDLEGARRGLDEEEPAHLAAGRAVKWAWLVTDVLHQHPLPLIPDHDFNVICRRLAVAECAREVLRNLKLAADDPTKVSGAGTMPLPGFRHLQQGYPVERDGEIEIVAINKMTREERLARARQYRTMARGCIAHAEELERYRGERDAA